MKPDQFHAIAACYLAAKQALDLARAERFQHHCVVVVNSPRYHGSGIVVIHDGCPPEMLPVLLENGNTWHYPVSDCLPIVRGLWPDWVKRQIRRWNRIKKQTAAVIAKGLPRPPQ